MEDLLTDTYLVQGVATFVTFAAGGYMASREIYGLEQNEGEGVDAATERAYMRGFEDECPWEDSETDDTESLLEENN